MDMREDDARPVDRTSLVRIAAQFLRLGLTAFGGPAMIPYIRRMAVDKKGWLTQKDFDLGMACAQSIPGATAMQMAAYVGLRARGGPGALAAYIAFGLPAFAMITALSWLYFTYRETPAVWSVFKGLGVVVVALICHAALDFSQKYLRTTLDKCLALAAGLWLGFRLNPILAIAGISLASVFLYKDVHGLARDTGPGEPAGRAVARAGIAAAVVLGSLAALYLAGLRDLFDLAGLMMKIDVFAFGGGYVSLPLMLHEFVGARGWLTQAQFMDGIAMGQITPGPIVMTSAFVGFAVAGPVGAATAAWGAFAPSFVILAAVVPFYDRLIASPALQRALKGSLITLVGLMAAVFARFALATDWSPAALAVGLGSLAALRLGADIIWVVPAGALAGLILM